MSDASSSILFVPQGGQQQRWQDRQSESLEYAPSENKQYVINPSAQIVNLTPRQTQDRHGETLGCFANQPLVRSERVNIQKLHDLYRRGVERRREHEEWSKAEHSKEMQAEEKECTFRPQLSTFARGMRRPQHLSPENRFRSEVNAKEERLAFERTSAAARELTECTFRPLTLSAAKVKPQSYVRRNDRHQLLHEEAAHRNNVRGVIMDLLRSNRKSQPELLEEEIGELVGRLAAPVERSPQPRVRFDPRINPTSQKIVEDMRSQDPTPQSVVDRLFRASKRRDASTEGHINVVSHSPTINHRSREILAQSRERHIRGLFREISGGEVNRDVVGLARQALEVLPLEAADDIVSILRASSLERLTEDDFVTLCQREEFMNLVALAPKIQGPGARQNRKVLNPKNHNKFIPPTFTPELNPHSRFLAKEVGIRKEVRRPPANDGLKVSPTASGSQKFSDELRMPVAVKRQSQQKKHLDPAERTQGATGESWVAPTSDRQYAAALLRELSNAVNDLGDSQSDPSEGTSSQYDDIDGEDANILRLLQRRRELA